MKPSPPPDELAGLHRFIEKLESGYLRLRRNQVDLTKMEATLLKREIARLERIIQRAGRAYQNESSDSRRPARRSRVLAGRRASG
jgi:hypothetical protein